MFRMSYYKTRLFEALLYHVRNNSPKFVVRAGSPFNMNLG